MVGGGHVIEYLAKVASDVVPWNGGPLGHFWSCFGLAYPRRAYFRCLDRPFNPSTSVLGCAT